MKFYTPEQASVELGVSRRTLARWRGLGRFIPDSKTAGGHSRYSEKQIKNAKKGEYENAVEDPSIEDLLR